MSGVSGLPLYWRVCLINGLVFVAGTAALALSPATVSARVLVSEAIVLCVGLIVIVVLNGLLLRRSLTPLDRVMRLMREVDLDRPGLRLPDGDGPTMRPLVTTFNDMLSRLETEGARRSAVALAAQEAERHRIAQELHDEIGQALTAVLLGLKRCADSAPTPLAAELVEVQDMVRSTLDEVRHVARRLRPGVLDELGLLSALAALSSDVAARSGVSVSRGFAPGLPDMSAETEVVVYRVAQEALTNVTRHSGARRVHVSLTRQGRGIALHVSDDGIGLASALEGSGLRGMRERAALVGGTFEVGPRPGGGTEIRLVVPLLDEPTAPSRA